MAKIDRATVSKTRGQFARLAVIINTREPLVSKILIDGRVQRVEYECLPQVCFGCGRLGHTRETCAYAEYQEEKADNSKVAKENECKVSEEKLIDEQFGPWMIVEKRKILPSKTPVIKPNHRNNESMMRGSRFGVLEINDEQTVDVENREHVGEVNRETTDKGIGARKSNTISGGKKQGTKDKGKGIYAGQNVKFNVLKPNNGSKGGTSTKNPFDDGATMGIKLSQKIMPLSRSRQWVMAWTKTSTLPLKWPRGKESTGI